MQPASAEVYSATKPQKMCHSIKQSWQNVSVCRPINHNSRKKSSGLN